MAEHAFNFRGLVPAMMTVPVAASTLIERGNIVALDSAGRAIEGTTVAGGAVAGIGRALAKADNSSGDAGDIDVQVELGVFEWLNSAGDAVSAADVGKPVYIEGEATVAQTSSSGTLVEAGIMTELTAAGKVAVHMSPWVALAARASALADAGVALQKRTVTVAHGDLTDADTSQTINIGAVLPANARIIGVDMRALTAFSGGTVSALVVDVGTSGDVDALVDGADLFTAAVDGGPATMPLGIRHNKTFASAGAQLVATFVSTTDNLVNLTAGTVTIDVLFSVLA